MVLIHGEERMVAKTMMLRQQENSGKVTVEKDVCECASVVLIHDKRTMVR